jgi:hypothetical protein
MIAAIIRWSIANRFLVIVLTVLLTGWGIYALRQTPVDALPDLSDVQVIIKTSFPGQAPQVVEDQVTYPLATAMLSVPKALSVRGYSFFGDSYVYIIFEDGTDLYWARSRVLEYLSQVAGQLPESAKPALGPDATGVGWIFQYALVDRTGQHDLAELRSLQDWFLKYELQTVPGVAEVATVGGMVRQYQVVVDPDKLRAFGIPLSKLKNAIRNGNQETGGNATGSVGCRGDQDWSADASRDRRTGRRRRSRRRRDRDALGRERVEDHRPGQSAARRTPAQPARRRRGCRHLRPLGPHRARGRHSARQAHRGIPGSGAGLRRVPVPHPIVGGHLLQPAGRNPGRVHHHAPARHQREHHVARRHRASCPYSRWRLRKAACSRRSRSPRPTRWRQPPACR